MNVLPESYLRLSETSMMELFAKRAFFAKYLFTDVLQSSKYVSAYYNCVKSIPISVLFVVLVHIFPHSMGKKKNEKLIRGGGGGGGTIVRDPRITTRNFK